MTFVEMAQQIVQRYEMRLTAGDAQAKAKLVNEIAIALSDVRANVGVTEAVANMLGKKPESERTPPPDPAARSGRSLAISKKILNGQPLTGDEENDIIFGGL